MKQAPYRGLTNISHHHAKFNWPGDLALGICAALHKPTESRQEQFNTNHYVQIIKLTVWTDLFHTAVCTKKDQRHTAHYE
jgi:hypothetical protein